MLAVQYLEDGPHLAAIAPDDACARPCARPRAAFERLPISCVVLGWRLPDAVYRCCAKEVARQGAQLFRWHPLLAGDATFAPRPEWRVVGLDGGLVPGFQDLPEFTFICPHANLMGSEAMQAEHSVRR